MFKDCIVILDLYIKCTKPVSMVWTYVVSKSFWLLVMKQLQQWEIKDWLNEIMDHLHFISIFNIKNFFNNLRDPINYQNDKVASKELIKFVESDVQKGNTSFSANHFILNLPPSLILPPSVTQVYSSHGSSFIDHPAIWGQQYYWIYP